jgi:hypothetical protein
MKSSALLFSLEEKIMYLWSLDQDVQMVRSALLDGDDPLSEDEIDNYLLTIINLINLRCNELMKTYQSILQEVKDESDDML